MVRFEFCKYGCMCGKHSNRRKYGERGSFQIKSFNVSLVEPENVSHKYTHTHIGLQACIEYVRASVTTAYFIRRIYCDYSINVYIKYGFEYQIKYTENIHKISKRIKLYFRGLERLNNIM